MAKLPELLPSVGKEAWGWRLKVWVEAGLPPSRGSWACRCNSLSLGSIIYKTGLIASVRMAHRHVMGSWLFNSKPCAFTTLLKWSALKLMVTQDLVEWLPTELYEESWDWKNNLFTMKISQRLGQSWRSGRIRVTWNSNLRKLNHQKPQ